MEGKITDPQVFKLVQIIERLYEVLRVVDGDRRPSIGLVYAKFEAVKKKIREVSPRYAHMVLDVVESRWDQQMSRDLHKAGEENVARATTERGEYELDEETDNLEDSPRPNTFLAMVVAEATTEEEGGREDVGQPYSSQFQADPEAKVDLLGDIELERVERTIGGEHGQNDDDFERLMEGLPRTRSLREAPSQSIRTRSSTHVAAPSQSRRPSTSSQLIKRKQIAQESHPKKIGATESHPTKGIVIREPPPLIQKKKGWLSGWGSKKGKKGATLVEDPLDIADAETLDPNAEDDTPSSLDSPWLPNSASHDSMTTSGSSSDGGGGDGDTPQEGGGGDSGQRGGGGDSGQGGGGAEIAFT
ncbi:hypothetical protein Taro_037980 [Colocasia esculenta]|uniref:Uncharacterized protein n=1 Tax=Colocasia esculenta TaxID=4460 RepID=A0A843WMA8_COLES|nr:hypothetical protein [Colocasia esculenta]